MCPLTMKVEYTFAFKQRLHGQIHNYVQLVGTVYKCQGLLIYVQVRRIHDKYVRVTSHFLK